MTYEDIGINKVDHVVWYENPELKLDRIVQMCRNGWPETKDFAQKTLPRYINEKHAVTDIIQEKLNFFNKDNIHFVDHHLSHASAAFLTSPFEESVIITMDGVGEWATTAIGYANNVEIKLEKEIRFPNSLGLLYSAFTQYLGFKVNDGEYRTMGLAPYGEPKYVDIIKDELVDIKRGGDYRLNFEYFEWQNGIRNYNDEFEKLFGLKTRTKDVPIEQMHKDLAKSVQLVLEEIILKIAKKAHRKYKIDNLCIGGGVGLNCVANSMLLKKSPFKRIFVHPASTDAGGALGCAMYVNHYILGNKSCKNDYFDPLLGSDYTDESIEYFLDSNNIKYEKMSQKELYQYVAKEIDNQKIVGWFQGKSEWGPRALGNRSILADARNVDNWQRVNLHIKFRESFRPFAPSALWDDSPSYFDIDEESPYMLFTYDTKTDKLPAVTHVDGSSRVQTVDQGQNQKYHDLLQSFKELTGTGVFINTSFNKAGDPIVNSPFDAYKTFETTKMDILVVGNYVVKKNGD